MVIIIDGYNLLKNVYKGKDITEQQRAQFISRLGRYAKRKKHRIILVFDGGPYEWPSKKRESGIHVIYSGVHDSADDVIRNTLEDRKTDDILLVSSDNELASYAGNLGLASIGSYAFYQIYSEAFGSHPLSVHDSVELQKTSGEENIELDILMTQASKHVPIKSEDLTIDTTVLKPKGKKKSKVERLLQKKIDKL